MPYLIDGHNLIPKFGLRLDSVNDEMELVSILQEFARLKRQKVEVYFDERQSVQPGPAAWVLFERILFGLGKLRITPSARD